MVCCACLLTGLLSGCNQNSTSSGDAISTNSILSTDVKYDFKVTPKDSEFSKTIADLFYKNNTFYTASASSFDPSPWGMIMSNPDYPHNFVYATIGKRLNYNSNEWHNGYASGFVAYEALIDNVLYGDQYKKGDSVILLQPGYADESASPPAYGFAFEGYNFFKAGMRLSLNVIKEKIESTDGTSTLEVCKILNPMTTGYIGQINGEEYIVYRHCAMGSDDLPIELQDRGLIKSDDDAILSQVEYEVADIKGEKYVAKVWVYSVKTNVYEEFMKLNDQYKQNKELVKSYEDSYERTLIMWGKTTRYSSEY